MHRSSVSDRIARWQNDRRTSVQCHIVEPTAYEMHVCQAIQARLGEVIETMPQALSLSAANEQCQMLDIDTCPTNEEWCGFETSIGQESSRKSATHQFALNIFKIEQTKSSLCNDRRHNDLRSMLVVKPDNNPRYAHAPAVDKGTTNDASGELLLY